MILLLANQILAFINKRRIETPNSKIPINNENLNRKMG